MLDARQLGLKLIANVTFGYTSAHFSGRMPCVEVSSILFPECTRDGTLVTGHGARHETRDMGHETRDTRYEIRDTAHETWGTRHETWGTGCKARNTRHGARDKGHGARDTRHGIQGTKHEKWDKRRDMKYWMREMACEARDMGHGI